MAIEDTVQEVVGTVREPDGKEDGLITALVLSTQEKGKHVAIPRKLAIELASSGKLRSRTRDCLAEVSLSKVEDGMGNTEFVLREPGSEEEQTLLDMPIYAASKVVLRAV